jgi:glyoxylase-like metal-dependent hydrolase (beta-lactamase superfamily II)
MRSVDNCRSRSPQEEIAMHAMLKFALVPFLSGLLLSGAANAQVTVAPFFPKLPHTAALAPEVAADVSKKGYHVSEINRSGTYLITDGGYQAWAIVTQRGVILVDVPEALPFRPPLKVVPAIAEITDKPITHLIYSHAHSDHIGGASTVVKAFPDVKIIAHKRTKEILVRNNDPRRPVPHQTFEENLHLDIGGKRLELSYHGNIHQEGNIWIYAPNERILMVVDVIFPGWVPWRRLAVSEDIAGWMRGPDVALTFDFDVLIGGHITRLGNRKDVLIQKQYMQDMVTFTEEIINDPNVLSTAVNAIDAVHGKGSALQTVAKWALYSAFYDASIAHCANKMNAKYIEGPYALGGAETLNFPNCEAYFVARRLGVQ